MADLKACAPVLALLLTACDLQPRIERVKSEDVSCWRILEPAAIAHQWHCTQGEQAKEADRG